MSNIPSQLSEVKTTDLNFRPGFDLKKEVESLMAEQEKNPPSEETKRVEIAPEASFTQPTPAEMALKEGLVPTNDPEISDDEKALFLKALLNDVCVRLPIILFNGQLKVECRGRYTHEVKLVFDLLREDIERKIIPPDDVTQYMTRMQKYFLAVTVERVNDVKFAPVGEIDKNNIQAAGETLRDFANKIEFSQTRWTALLNAFSQFESKCAKLSTQAINEDFWKPRG